MAELRPHYIDVDLKKNTQYNVPVVTQNDTATHFIIRVTDDGLSDPELLDAYQEITMTSQRPDGESFYLTGTRIPGTNEIEFHLGTDETAFSGSVLASLQFYLVEDASRYTSAQFRYDVKKDLTKNYTPTQREETLVEVVLRDGPGVIQEAREAIQAADGAIGRLEEVTEENKTIFREPVATFAALSTTYPNPEHGTTVRVTSEAASYRYSDGTWVKTDEYNPTAIDQVTAQLAETSQEVQRKREPEDLSDRTMALVTGNGTVNVLSEPQAGSVTLEKLSPQSFELRQAETDTMTNIIENGNFATPWLLSNSTHSVLNSIGTFTATAANGRIHNTIQTVEGHKYFLRLFVRTNTDKTGARLTIGGRIGYSTGTGAFEEISNIIVGGVTGATQLRIEDTRTTGWDAVEVKEVQIIDLTATYGAGNEPSAEEFKVILSQTNNGQWFSGTTERLIPFGEDELIYYDGTKMTSKPKSEISLGYSNLTSEAVTSLTGASLERVAKQYQKPTYGVDSMSYYERRDRLPITARNYSKINIPLPTRFIDGYPALGEMTSEGATYAINMVANTIDATLAKTISFDYFAGDKNITSLRLDFESGSSANVFRFNININELSVGVNHLVLNKSEVTTIIGNPNWNNITLARVRGETEVGKRHDFAVGEVRLYSFPSTVTIWFDDQLKSVYTVAKPIMDQYHFKGVQAVIGERVAASNSYQNHTELAQMFSEGWEHCNHTYKHEKFGEVSADRVRLSIQRGLDYCLAKGYGKSSYYLVNPGSQSTDETLPIEKEYSTLRRIGVGYNLFPIVDMYKIVSREPQWNDTVETVKGWIDKSIEDGTWLILLFHGIHPQSNGAASSFWSTENFTEIMAYLNQKHTAGNLRVKTCSEALSLI